MTSRLRPYEGVASQENWEGATSCWKPRSALQPCGRACQAVGGISGPGREGCTSLAEAAGHSPGDSENHWGAFGDMVILEVNLASLSGEHWLGYARRPGDQEWASTVHRT